jgi:hypothetical protein
VDECKPLAPGQPMTCDNVNRILALEGHVPTDPAEHSWLAAIARNTLRLMDESVEEGVAIHVSSAKVGPVT